MVILSGSSHKDASGSIVFQPVFRWGSGACTSRGTGFFTKAPTGQVIGVTSAHLINESDPQLSQATWTDLHSGHPVATFTKTYGKPGNAGSTDPLDLGLDYLLLASDTEVDSDYLLTIEETKVPEVGETIWFPNKCPGTSVGYEWISGKVVAVQDEYYKVVLDKKMDLTARSGTPVISGQSGKVIGILSRGDDRGDQPILYLTPSLSLHQALNG